MDEEEGAIQVVQSDSDVFDGSIVLEHEKLLEKITRKTLDLRYSSEEPIVINEAISPENIRRKNQSFKVDVEEPLI